MASLFDRFSAAFGRQDALIASLRTENADLLAKLAAEDLDDAALQEAAATAAAERDAALARNAELQALADADAEEDAKLVSLVEMYEPAPEPEPTPEPTPEG